MSVSSLHSPLPQRDTPGNAVILWRRMPLRGLNSLVGLARFMPGIYTVIELQILTAHLGKVRLLAGSLNRHDLRFLPSLK